MFTITIDGPSASGKSTVAKLVAKELNMHHLNSGEFYRAIAYYMNKNKIMPEETEKVSTALKNLNITIEFINGVQHNFVNGEDVSEFLHNNDINNVVSRYARNFDVVEKTSELTFLATKTHSLVIDGRNVGSYVLPNAECKIYLDCNAKIRAERRMKEEIEKGYNVSFDEIYKQTLERDELDKTRKIAPLIVPENAYILDSSNKSIEEIKDEIVNLAKTKMQN